MQQPPLFPRMKGMIETPEQDGGERERADRLARRSNSHTRKLFRIDERAQEKRDPLRGHLFCFQSG